MNEYLNLFLEGSPQLNFFEKLPEEFGLVSSSLQSLQLRSETVHKYSFAIPDEDSLNLIAKYSPILEIGAGTGYWAKLLNDIGVDILAYDNFSWKLDAKWFEVKEGSIEVIPDHPNRTLFLCWPDYNTSFAYDCLKAYKGDLFIFIGENRGCTGDDKFFNYLHKNFKIIERQKLYQWLGLHDDLSIFQRKKLNPS